MILGENAGPSKLVKIKSLGTKTLDEDGFLALIAKRDAGELDEKTKKKLADEKKKIQLEAQKMIAEEKAADKAAEKALKEKEAAGGSSQQASSSKYVLWPARSSSVLCFDPR